MSARAALASSLLIAPLGAAGCGGSAAAAAPAADCREANPRPADAVASPREAWVQQQCAVDPHGVHCESSTFVTRAAALCLARRHDGRREFDGGLYFSKDAHGPVYQLFSRLQGASSHAHLTLDAVSGKPVLTLPLDLRNSEVSLLVPDGQTHRAASLTGHVVLEGDALRFLSVATKLGPAPTQIDLERRISVSSSAVDFGATSSVKATVEVGSTPQESKFTADIQVVGDEVEVSADVELSGTVASGAALRLQYRPPQ